MFKFLKTTIGWAVFFWAVFTIVAIWGGGEKIRWLADFTSGTAQKGIEKLAQEADELKDKADKIRENLARRFGPRDEQYGDKGRS